MGGCKYGAHKQSQMSQTLIWLTSNYERSEGVCLPRCVLYSHYLDFCKTSSFTPAGAATFGKIIRQRFPKLTTRRLGTRGQSKYHYYGIGIKESSKYYNSVYNGKGLTRFSGTKVKTEGTTRKHSLSSKSGTILPDLPTLDQLILPDGPTRDKVETLLLMYRTHCQRILDTIINANFQEVQSFLLHFWQGMPEHLEELLDNEMIHDVILYCDSVLYKVMMDVLIPTSVHDMPDSLSSEIKVFTNHFLKWVESAVEEVPEKLANRKTSAAKSFLNLLRKQVSFVQLAQTSRSVLTSQESTDAIVQDFDTLDFDSIILQASQICPVEEVKLAVKYIRELRSLLLKQEPIEAYAEWLDTVVDDLILQRCATDTSKLQSASVVFLQKWNFISNLLMKELTICSASTFGPCHLIRLLLDEYIMLIMESWHHQHAQQDIKTKMRNHVKAESIQLNDEPKFSESSRQTRKRRASDMDGTDDDSDEKDVSVSPVPTSLSPGSSESSLVSPQFPSMASNWHSNQNFHHTGVDSQPQHFGRAQELYPPESRMQCSYMSPASVKVHPQKHPPSLDGNEINHKDYSMFSPIHGAMIERLETNCSNQYMTQGYGQFYQQCRRCPFEDFNYPRASFFPNGNFDNMQYCRNQFGNYGYTHGSRLVASTASALPDNLVDFVVPSAQATVNPQAHVMPDNFCAITGQICQKAFVPSMLQ